MSKRPRLGLVLVSVAALALSSGATFADEMKKKEKAPPAGESKPAPAKPAPTPAPACKPAGVNTLEDLYAYIGQLERLQAAETEKAQAKEKATEVNWREVPPDDGSKKK